MADRGKLQPGKRQPLGVIELVLTAEEATTPGPVAARISLDVRSRSPSAISVDLGADTAAQLHGNQICHCWRPQRMVSVVRMTTSVTVAG